MRERFITLLLDDMDNEDKVCVIKNKKTGLYEFPKILLNDRNKERLIESWTNKNLDIFISSLDLREMNEIEKFSLKLPHNKVFVFESFYQCRGYVGDIRPEYKFVTMQEILDKRNEYYNSTVIAVKEYIKHKEGLKNDFQNTRNSRS